MADFKFEILHEASWGFIEYMPDVPCLRHAINGFSLSEEVRSRHDLLLALLIEKKKLHPEIGLLIDPRKAEPLLEEDIEWLMTDWTPRVAQHSIKYIAVLTPEDEWSKISVDMLKENKEYQERSGGTHKYFLQHESALAWLHDVLNN